MKSRRIQRYSLFLAVLISCSANPSWAATNISEGSNCKVQNKQQIFKGKLFVCAKIGNKYRWKQTSVKQKRNSGTEATQALPVKQQATASDLVPGLIAAKYSGYHEDQTDWFAGKAADSVEVSNVIDLQTGSGDYFSVRWTGYFIPTETGKWKFATISDDGSNLWLGRSAIESEPKGAPLLAAPGIHGPFQREKEVTLIKGKLYPIRIHFGDATNWAQMTFFYRSPSSQMSKSDLTGLVWHSAISSETYSGIDSKYASEIYANSSTSASANLPIVTPAGDLQDMATCKLKNSAPSNINGRGFPLPSSRLATKGVISGLVLFVDFPDVSGDGDLETRFKTYTDKFIDFYREQSYGRLQIEMKYVPKYFRISRNSSEYGMQIHNAGNPWMYLKDALSASDTDVDYSAYDFVVVIPPQSIGTIVYGPAFPVAMGDNQLRTNEKVLYNATVAGSDAGEKIGRAWFWLSHEVGHLFGLEHQYTWSNVTYESKLQGVWDLMNTGDQAPELLAWHRFVLNWLDGTTAQCIDSASVNSRESIHLIAPIESKKVENKALFIKLNEYELLAVEVRRNMGFDSISEFEEGAIVYKVNVRDLQDNQEVLLLTQSPQPYGATIVGNLVPGDSVTDSGVEIKVLESTLNGDIVQVKILK